MKTFKIKILGDEWKVCNLTPQQFAKLDTVTSKTRAIAFVHTHTLYFREDDIAFDTIKHEVGHAFFSYQSANASMEMSFADWEELTVEFVAQYGERILKTAKVIFKKL